MASSVACFKDKFTLARQHRLHIYTERKSETERERESETGGRNRQSCCERINLSVKHEKRSLCNFTALVRRSTAVQFPRYFHIIFASFPSRTQAGNHRSRNDGVITDGNTVLSLCQSVGRDRHELISFFIQLQQQHFPAVSGAFMDSPYNGDTSLQTSSSNLNASYSRPSEAEDDGKVSSDTIWLWIAVLATIGNIVVVAVVCACAF
ncbi:hypothetical protein JOB18_016576 [Solea senegalensis]|uniref:Uncharacterized protein n=1 Tax=Solea senegalensis TaxID=28829 RepID=A0AAV6PZI0_SOLSE|nr:hypothetical protein JOB18_016576 [Solea senegalensis]